MIPFARGLAGRLDPAEETWRGEVVRSLGTTAAVLVVVAAAALSTTGVARLTGDVFDESSEPLAGESVAILPQLGFVTVVFAYWTIAVAVVCASSLILRGELPRVLGWLGFACAGLTFLAPAVAPMLLFPLWMLAVGVAMLVRQGAQPVAAG
jgi:hypothetical protein